MKYNAVTSYDEKLAMPLIKKWEGCKLAAYKCPAGVWTIGYGHTAGVKQGDSCTQEQADEYLKEDLKGTKRDLSRLLDRPVTEGMFKALMSFVYNIGYAKCSKYSIFRMINLHGDYEGAGNKLVEYCYAGQKKLQGLLNRREDEKKAYFERYYYG